MTAMIAMTTSNSMSVMPGFERRLERTGSMEHLAMGADLCRHDADLEQGLISRTRRRPKSCLNAYDPTTSEIPF